MESPPAGPDDEWAPESHCGAINPDYFALDSAAPRRPPPPPSDPDSDSSDNPSWLEPDSSSRFADPLPAPISWSDSDPNPSEPSADESDAPNDPYRPPSVEAGSDSSVGPETPRSNEGAAAAAAAAAAAWWKLPLELVKLWAARMRPAWTISIAAAILGVVMLGRKLYKMRHKGRGVLLRVSHDEKKASQFMARAARLNEAFSVVRRAPMIRPSLPSSGLTPWPVVGLL